MEVEVKWSKRGASKRQGGGSGREVERGRKENKERG